MPAGADFSRRPTPGPLSAYAVSDFNAMETDKGLGDDLSGVYQVDKVFSRGCEF